MKIGVSDPDNFKFSQQLIDHWRELGHEVKTSLYHEERFVNECDVIFYEFATQAVVELSRAGVKPKRVVVRSIDIENYMGYFREFNWDLIDAYIFLNEAQKRMMIAKEDFKCPPEKMHVIPCGVNLDKFTLVKNRQENPFKIGFVGRLWIGKNVLEALQLAEAWGKAHNNVEFHICGERFDPDWWHKLCEYRIETSKVPVFFDGVVDSMNDYLEDKSLLIMPSFKEAFSYVTAEALAKGIPAITSDWYGSRDVWPDEIIFRNQVEAIEKIEALLKRTPEELRQIAAKYDEKFMFEKIDQLMGLI